MSDAYAVATTAIAAASSVTALVGTRYWPDRADEETPTLPFIIFQNITDLRYDHLAGPGTGKRCRVQFTCYGENRLAASNLADLLESHLAQSGRILFRQSGYDFEVQAYWSQIDWSVIFDSP